jgi:dTDP-4-amino-4,6-dideoxygalactose transaminase
MSHTPIPFVDLVAGVRPHREQYLEAIAKILDTGAFIGGKAVTDFEAAFAGFCGSADAVSLGTGTDALLLALRALGVGPGDEVITATNSFFATAEAISLVGATPVLVDVRDDTLTIDPAAVERAIGPRTRCLIPVHLFGQLADMDAILAIAERHKLLVLEDSAQAHGATRKVRGELRKAGSIGHAGAFSFYPTKNLGAFGEGGAVTTSDPEVAARMRRLRDHGQGARHDHLEVGYNARLNAISCACLSISLAHLEEANAKRRALAAHYRAQLADVPAVRLVTEDPGATAVYHLMIVRVDAGRRDAVRDALAREGIATAIHYPTPIHLQKAYAHLGQAAGSCPVAERAAKEMISLPMYPELPLAAVDRVVDALQRALA